MFVLQLVLEQSNKTPPVLDQHGSVYHLATPTIPVHIQMQHMPVHGLQI